MEIWGLLNLAYPETYRQRGLDVYQNCAKHTQKMSDRWVKFRKHPFTSEDAV